VEDRKYKKALLQALRERTVFDSDKLKEMIVAAGGNPQSVKLRKLDSALQRSRRRLDLRRSLMGSRIAPADLSWLGQIELHAGRLADLLKSKAKGSVAGEVNSRAPRMLQRAGADPSQIREAMMAVVQLGEWANVARRASNVERGSATRAGLAETLLLTEDLPEIFSSFFARFNVHSIPREFATRRNAFVLMAAELLGVKTSAAALKKRKQRSKPEV
jgi:hypothetical protein